MILISCIQTLPHNDFVPVRQQVGFNMHEHRHGLCDFATLVTQEVVESNSNPVPLSDKSLTKVAASYSLCNDIMEKIEKVKNKSGVVIDKDRMSRISMEHTTWQITLAAKMLEIEICQLFELILDTTSLMIDVGG